MTPAPDPAALPGLLVDAIGEERLDQGVQLLERLGDGAARRAGAQAWQALEGDAWLGHPVHPALTDLPIGFWTSALVLDLGGRRVAPAATAMVAAGLAAAAPTALAGLADWRRLDEQERRRVGVAHAAANTVATLLYAGSLAHRLRGNRLRGVCLGVAGAVAATAGGLLGGHLAFGSSSSSDVAGSSDGAGGAEIVDQQGAALAAAG